MSTLIPLRKVLNSHTMPELKREIRKTNITGYSKLKKGGLVSLMARKEHKEKFSHLKFKQKSRVDKEVSFRQN